MRAKLYKDLDFKSEEEYYNYVIESSINGQNQQCGDLISQLTKQEKKDFFHWLMTEEKSTHIQRVISLLIHFI